MAKNESIPKLNKPLDNRIVGHDMVAVDQLLANPRNWRLHPRGQQEALAGSIDDVGFIRSITVNKVTGAVVDGHARVTLAARSGVEALPVEWVELSEADEAKALALLDPISAMAEADTAKLDELLRIVNSDDARVQEALAEIAEANKLQYGEQPPEDAEPAIDRAEELRVKWGVELGQMWRLPARDGKGEHRLICGDCTDRDVVGRVMGGEKAGAVVTDPPYGINREGIENDDPEGLPTLFDGCLSVMPIENAVVIAFQSPRLFPVWLDAIRAHGHQFNRLLWMYDENDQTKPWHFWLMCSQAISVSSFGSPDWKECKSHHDTYVIGLSREWRAGGRDNDYPHASVKPEGVVSDLLGHIGGTVYDPFSGSGTTIIAAENLSRYCRAVEISPGYVAVSLERYFMTFNITPELMTP